MKSHQSFKYLLFLSILFIISSCKKNNQSDIPWTSLFDGQTLDGWTQKGGKAIYQIKERTIVGSTVYNTSNSFLTTDKMYGDFILGLGFLIDSILNYGIQRGSNSFSYDRIEVIGDALDFDKFELKLAC